MVTTSTIIALYYNVIIAWSIYYFFASMTSDLPWTDCDNWWNSEQCFTSDFLKENCTGATSTHLNTPLRSASFVFGFMTSEVNATHIACDGDVTYVVRSEIQTPSEEYF